MELDAEVHSELRRRYSEKIASGKWAEIAKELSDISGIFINRGNLWKIWHGKSRSNKIRKALGLLPVGVICRCGKVHQHKCRIGKQIEYRERSSESDQLFLKFIQEQIVPWLREREALHGSQRGNS